MLNLNKKEQYYSKSAAASIFTRKREEERKKIDINFVEKVGLKKSHKLEEFVDVANQERYETVGKIEQETIRGINGIREQQEGIRE